VDWIRLAQDRDKLWGTVSLAMKFWVSINVGNFFVGRETTRFANILFCDVSWLIGLKCV